MKSKKHKSISVFLTSLVIVTLILMGPANAISINISNPNDATQGEKVNFEIDPEKGVRFFDPFNFFTRGIYKDMDGLTVWTQNNLKEPWEYE